MIAETNYSLGMFYAQQNQLDRAAQFLAEGHDPAPDYPEAMNNLGVLYVREQNYAKAEEQFRDCIRVTPNFDQSYLNLARLYMMQNDKEQARAALKTCCGCNRKTQQPVRPWTRCNAMP